ncbi:MULTISPECIES: hypothetical protein [Pseudomonas]|uniref:Uncharacterized protein n=1 Tax=Pseudomonas eucalypticola TaxID=2599595 RepID=A0A7D5D754_9PSED|nr:MULTISPECIES: hypothetical protein [Pseudomonas]QKZ05094.1 hypothetical protein HWQ56_15365 [Pseudomonas eucalypticola]WAH56098.1 hypothetical protein LZ023_24115 [Pseudomonas silvicola]
MLRLVLLFLLQMFRRLFSGTSVSPRAELQGTHADEDEGRWTATSIAIICALVIYIIGGLGLYGKTHIWDTLTPAQKDFIVQSMITDQQVL